MSVATISKTSSLATASSGVSVDSVNVIDAVPAQQQGWAASALESPNLSKGSLFASSARLAARINATSVPVEERRKLLADRQLLLDKLFEGVITSDERDRLAYVRWNLDRIDDAENGPVLDALEQQIEAYEHIASEIDKYHSQLEGKAERKARR